MPHAHSRPFHIDLENTIDRLLAQGAKISDALENEVEHAENQYVEAPKKDRRGSSTTTESNSVAPSEVKPTHLASQTAKGSTTASEAKTKRGSSNTPSLKSVKEVSIDSDKSVPLSSLKSSDRSATPSSSQFTPKRRVPLSGGKPVWTKGKAPSAPSSSSLTHTFDLDDISSLQYSSTQFTGTSNSRATMASSMISFKNGGNPTFTLPPKQEDITSDMLVPPSAASSVRSTAVDPRVNDAMPKPGDIFLGVKSYPCFIREGDEVVERQARVTFTRRANSSWLLMLYEVDDSDGRDVLVIRCEVLGRYVRNVFINGDRRFE